MKNDALFSTRDRESMPTCSWWAVPPAEFPEALRRETPRIMGSRFARLLGPGSYGDRGIDLLTQMKQRKAMTERAW